MKKILRIAAVIVSSLLLVSVGIILFIVKTRPAIDAPDLKVETTPARVERGRYLANHVTMCMDCHATRDWSKYSGPPIEETKGRGGEHVGHIDGFPGEYYSPNITPYALKGWSDGEIYRAITSGINNEGKPFFPIMPYPNYNKLNTEDVYSIIAYLKTLDPIEGSVPDPKTDFPLSIIMYFIPKAADPQPLPDTADKEAYGTYIANAASCIECHTPIKKGRIIIEKAFSGGREFQLPFGIVRSANITPDKTTGIGKWSEEKFLARFAEFDSIHYQPGMLDSTDANTVMPWTMYAGMKRSDLKAIYAYLRTVKPIEHDVLHFEKKNLLSEE